MRLKSNSGKRCTARATPAPDPPVPAPVPQVRNSGPSRLIAPSHHRQGKGNRPLSRACVGIAHSLRHKADRSTKLGARAAAASCVCNGSCAPFLVRKSRKVLDSGRPAWKETWTGWCTERAAETARPQTNWPAENEQQSI